MRLVIITLVWIVSGWLMFTGAIRTTLALQDRKISAQGVTEILFSLLFVAVAATRLAP